jgi:hypothetical protein
MKLVSGNNLLLALCLYGKYWQSNAFFSSSPTGTGARHQTLLLKSSLSAFSEAGDLAVSQLAFPSDMELVRMEGGNTVRTWKIPHEAERAQIYIETNGRPLKATVQLVSTSNPFFELFSGRQWSLKINVPPIASLSLYHSGLGR